MLVNTRWICLLSPFYWFLLLCPAAFGQNADQSLPTSEQIDVYIQDGMEQLNITGAAFARFEDGEVTDIRGFGDADRSGRAVTTRTPFQIASVTKSFTSLVVLQLADEGRLSIDDPVVKHIPNFQTLDPEVSDTITIRHLMNHRSGLSTLDGNRYQRTTYRGADATERAVRRLKRARLQTTPGEWYQYSNANYATLAHLVETIEQMPFEQVLEARIFARLGMTNSFVQIPDKETVPEARGHMQWFGIPFEDHFIAGRMMVGAGSIVTSAEDLATYLIAVSQNDPRIVPPSLTESWAKDSEAAYEFGWQHDTFDGQHAIFHDGANPGFRAVVMYLPGTDKGALFLMNTSGALEGSLHYGAARYALGLPPVDISPAELFEKLLWGSLIFTIILMLGLALSVHRLRKNASKPWIRSIPVRWALMIIPSLCLAAFAFALWFYVPRSFGVNFAAASLFYPDLGLLQLAQIVIAVVWASIRIGYLVRRN